MALGEERAFDEFFEAYFPGIYRFALSRLRGDADAAEEVAQETLCRAVARIGTYRGEAMLFTWLCTFCRHEIAAYLRRRNRQLPSVPLAGDLPEVRAALESLGTALNEDPESAARRRELAGLVRAALDHLPRRHAAALRWKYLEGMSVREIAARMASSPKAAESVLTRAREGFREAFVLLAGPAAAGPGSTS
jgi:RNA polymerase sigma-70 factor (ECF subfamily)